MKKLMWYVVLSRGKESCKVCVVGPQRHSSSSSSCSELVLTSFWSPLHKAGIDTIEVLFQVLLSDQY